jgi:hypothetical protein
MAARRYDSTQRQKIINWSFKITNYVYRVENLNYRFIIASYFRSVHEGM